MIFNNLVIGSIITSVDFNGESFAFDNDYLEELIDKLNNHELICLEYAGKPVAIVKKHINSWKTFGKYIYQHEIAYMYFTEDSTYDAVISVGKTTVNDAIEQANKLDLKFNNIMISVSNYNGGADVRNSDEGTILVKSTYWSDININNGIVSSSNNDSFEVGESVNVLIPLR
jgi:hypothetical protein